VAKCKACNKGGIFFKVNTDDICKECEHTKRLEHKEIPAMEDAAEISEKRRNKIQRKVLAAIRKPKNKPPRRKKLRLEVPIHAIFLIVLKWIMLTFCVLSFVAGALIIANPCFTSIYDIAKFVKDYICNMCHQIGVLMGIAVLCVVIFLFLRYWIKKIKNKSSEFFMRDFLYFNMKFLETFMAQKDEGLVYDRKQEKGRGKSMTTKWGIFGTNFQYASTGTEVEREVRSMRDRENMLNAFLGSKTMNGKPLVKEIDRQVIMSNKIDKILNGKKCVEYCEKINRQILMENINTQMIAKQAVDQLNLNKEIDDTSIEEIAACLNKRIKDGDKAFDRVIRDNIVNLMFIDNIKDTMLRDGLDKNTSASITKELKASIGEYVCFKTYFDFISLKRLKTLVTPEKQKFYSKKEETLLMTREHSFSVKNEIEPIWEHINNLIAMFPFDSFLTAKNAIVLIETNQLRETDNQIGYKFNSNELVVVGKVYKRMSKIRIKSAPANQMLDNIQRMAIAIFRKIGIIHNSNTEVESEIFLIKPIAIYAEQRVLKNN